MDLDCVKNLSRAHRPGPRSSLRGTNGKGTIPVGQETERLLVPLPIVLKGLNERALKTKRHIYIQIILLLGMCF